MVLFYGEEFHAAWTPACEALLSGTPGFELAFGEDFYSYLKRCPDAGRRFLLAMKASNLAFHEIPGSWISAGVASSTSVAVPAN